MGRRHIERVAAHTVVLMPTQTGCCPHSNVVLAKAVVGPQMTSSAADRADGNGGALDVVPHAVCGGIQREALSMDHTYHYSKYVSK